MPVLHAAPSSGTKEDDGVMHYGKVLLPLWSLTFSAAKTQMRQNF